VMLAAMMKNDAPPSSRFDSIKRCIEESEGLLGS